MPPKACTALLCYLVKSKTSFILTHMQIWLDSYADMAVLFGKESVVTNPRAEFPRINTMQRECAPVQPLQTSNALSFVKGRSEYGNSLHIIHQNDFKGNGLHRILPSVRTPSTFLFPQRRLDPVGGNKSPYTGPNPWNRPSCQIEAKRVSSGHYSDME